MHNARLTRAWDNLEDFWQCETKGRKFAVYSKKLPGRRRVRLLVTFDNGKVVSIKRFAFTRRSAV